MEIFSQAANNDDPWENEVSYPITNSLNYYDFLSHVDHGQGTRVWGRHRYDEEASFSDSEAISRIGYPRQADCDEGFA